MALTILGKIIQLQIKEIEKKERQLKIDAVLEAYHKKTGKKVDLDINPYLHELLLMKLPKKK